jgi:hypothetical protein
VLVKNVAVLENAACKAGKAGSSSYNLYARRSHVVVYMWQAEHDAVLAFYPESCGDGCHSMVCGKGCGSL